MYRYQYLDKRNEKGGLLKFDAYTLSQEITEKFFNLISDSKIFKCLSDNFSKKYIEAYFKKMIYYEILPIAHQITIHKWEVRNKIHNKKAVIETKTFSFPKLLPQFIEDIYYFNFKNKINLLKFKKNIKNFLKFIYYKFLNLKKKNSKTFDIKNNNIAVCYGDGITEGKVSDLYWIYNSDINTSNIVLYIDYPSFLGRYEELNQKEEEEKIEKLEKQKGIKCIKIWELKKFEKKELYKNLKKKIKQISDKSYLDKILLSKSIELLDKIEFWHSFFEKYNIKIHMDPHDESIDNVVKQIGMYLVGGCSVGKYKSCLNKSDAINYGYYPNDVFCCWGKASIDHIKTKVKKKTLSNINNILITGYPYGYINKKEKLKIESIKNDLHKNGARFILLLLDTSSAYNNKNYDQVFPNDLLNKFYNFFLNWVIKDKEIGLIIKPKKLKILRSLNNSKNLIKDSTDTGRCYIHEKPFQSIPWHYSEISNMVVALTVDALPTALMECIINNKKIRGVFFDYPNLRKIESDLYLWGENKVVFDNMDKMMESIKKFKSNTNEDLGCWKEEFVNNLNTFKDNKGNIRVGNYVNDLIANFNANLNRNDAIKLANKKFSEKWGEKNTLIFKD